MKRRTSVALAVLIVLITAGCAVSGSENDKTKASASQTGQQVFIGVFREGAPRNMGYIKQFVDQTGKKPAMVMWYQDWAQKFPAEAAQNVVDFGAVPHIVWEPWYWGNRDKVKLDDIIAGKWDDYIKSWAKEIIAFKSPVFLRVGHEFNIDGYPWGIVHNEKDPEKYVKAYRHIVDVFRKEKVNNAKWIWCFMNYSFPDEPWNDWTKAYPGNDYVDWIGIDGYNWGKTQSWSDWQAFKYLFRDQVRQCRELWPDKPIMVAEFASAEKGGDKAAWIRELPGYLKSSMRDIDAIIWFDLKKEADWRITSSDKSLAAFKEIMKDPIFSSSGQAMAALSLTGKKAEKRLAEALRNYGTITVDGDLKEWGKCRPISMADRSFVKEGSDWGGPEDLSGLAYVMWDDEYLYFAADITDKIPLVNKQQKQDIWNGDAIEVVISVDPGAESDRKRFGRKDYQIGLSTGNGADNKPIIWNWQRRRMPDGSQIAVKKKAKPLGYALEAKIPWEFFRGQDAPKQGMKLGFDIAFDDADSTGQRERQMIWNGDYMFYKDPSVWGVLELK